MASTSIALRSAGVAFALTFAAAAAWADTDWTPTAPDDYSRAAWALHTMLCGEDASGPASAEQCEASRNASLQYLAALLALAAVQENAGQPVDLPPFPDFGPVLNDRIMTLAPTLTPGWQAASATSMEAAPESVARMAVQSLGSTYGLIQGMNINTTGVNRPKPWFPGDLSDDTHWNSAFCDGGVLEVVA